MELVDLSPSFGHAGIKKHTVHIKDETTEKVTLYSGFCGVCKYVADMVNYLFTMVITCGKAHIESPSWTKEGKVWTSVETFSGVVEEVLAEKSLQYAQIGACVKEFMPVKSPEDMAFMTMVETKFRDGIPLQTKLIIPSSPGSGAGSEFVYDNETAGKTLNEHLKRGRLPITAACTDEQLNEIAKALLLNAGIVATKDYDEAVSVIEDVVKALTRINAKKPSLTQCGVIQVAAKKRVRPHLFLPVVPSPPRVEIFLGNLENHLEMEKFFKHPFITEMNAHLKKVGGEKYALHSSVCTTLHKNTDGYYLTLDLDL